MNNTTITLLSPTHVGSGKFIQGNAEYLNFGNELAIVDESKILELIGVGNLNYWVDSIENPDLEFLNYLKKRTPNLLPSQTAKRVLPLVGDITPVPANTLREQIHTGTGKPYIPGSSIKGAIRTAFFATYMIDELGAIDTQRVYNPNRRNKFKDKSLTSEVFGYDPNHDWFRLIQIGDFHFEPLTKAAFSETLNQKGYKGEKYEIKHSLNQLVEFLPKGLKSTGSIKFNRILQEKARNYSQKDGRPIFNIRGDTVSLEVMLKFVNTQTQALLDKEIEKFEVVDLPDSVIGYPDYLKEILKISENLNENEAVLRMGWGTGFSNMTGGWVDSVLDNYQYDLLNDEVRSRKYNDFELPKSRKVLNGGIPFGFLKIKIDLPS